jgi:hypothetical protein
VIADSNHGYKMIGVGKLVADELLGAQARVARAVPVFALRRGQAASGEPQSLSVELMDKVLGRDRLVILAALAAVVALAWAILPTSVLAQPAMDMDAIAMAAMPPPVWDGR